MREWHDQDLFGDVLYDVFEGDIWDLNANVPLTHPNCRCQLAVRVTVQLDSSTVTDLSALQKLLGKVI